MRPTKGIAIILILCLLASIGIAGLTEEQALPVDAAAVDSTDPESGEAANALDAAPEESAFEEPEAELADSVDAETGLVVDDGTEAPMPIDTDAADDAPEPGEGSDLAVDAPLGLFYMEVAAAEAPVYLAVNDNEAVMLLHVGDLVLATGETGYYTAVAFYADGVKQSGFMQTDDLLSISDAAVQAKLNAAAASGAVALYDDDINWPLVPLTNVAYSDDRFVLAVKYTDYGLNKVYTINGKSIRAGQFGETGKGQCWKWAQKVYQAIWGCKFDTSFAGKESTGLNLLANMNDQQRLLTPAHLKAYIQNTQPGATLRIGSCPRSCSRINADSGCSHTKHSLIVVDKNEEGLVTMDSTGTRHCRFYTWEGFCNSWKNYTYIKYIKWPGAKPLPASAIPLDGSTVPVTGITVNQAALTLEIGGTATLVATIEPANATDTSVSWSSSNESVAKVQGGTITAVKPGAAKITVKTYDGEKTASCTVVVKNPVRTKALARTGSNGTIKIAPGEQVQLSATFATKRGWKIKSAKSSKSSCASIDSTGMVTARAVGTTKITVTTKNRKKATLKIVVEDPSTPSKVKLSRSGTVKIKVGQTLQLQAAVYPSAATTTYQWASSKSTIASVDQEGKVTACKKGTCYIGVRTANGKIAKVKIKVTK